MTALSATVSGYESVMRLSAPREIALPWVVAAAGLIGFAGNEAVAVYRIRVGRRVGSAALVADGLHARTDGFTSLAVLVGALGVIAGYPLADPIIGLLITLAILAVLRGAATDIYRRLMDAVNPSITDAAHASLATSPGITDVHALRLRWVGHRLHALAEVGIDPRLDLIAAHQISRDAESSLRHAVPHLAEVAVRPVPTTAANVAAASRDGEPAATSAGGPGHTGP